MLDLGVNPMHSNWQEVEQEIGYIKIQLGMKIVSENLEVEATKEKGVKEKGGEYPVHEGRVGILRVQGDTRWDQRKSGRAYNSDSGAHIICGNLTSRFVAIKCMSKRCVHCELKDLSKKEQLEKISKGPRASLLLTRITLSVPLPAKSLNSPGYPDPRPAAQSVMQRVSKETLRTSSICTMERHLLHSSSMPKPASNITSTTMPTATNGAQKQSGPSKT
jgi:hypothetical protein